VKIGVDGSAKVCLSGGQDEDIYMLLVEIIALKLRKLTVKIGPNDPVNWAQVNRIEKGRAKEKWDFGQLAVQNPIDSNRFLGKPGRKISENSFLRREWALSGGFRRG
jgi:hypothetical protein